MSHFFTALGLVMILTSKSNSFTFVPYSAILAAKLMIKLDLIERYVSCKFGKISTKGLRYRVHRLIIHDHRQTH